MKAGTEQTIRNGIEQYNKLLSSGSTQGILTSEIMAVHNMGKDELDLIVKAMMYGYAKGYRKALKDKREGRK